MFKFLIKSMSQEISFVRDTLRPVEKSASLPSLSRKSISARFKKVTTREFRVSPGTIFELLFKIKPRLLCRFYFQANSSRGHLKTLKQTLGFLNDAELFGNAASRFRGTVALRPSITASLPLSVVPNCQLKYTIKRGKMQLCQGVNMAMCKCINLLTPVLKKVQ